MTTQILAFALIAVVILALVPKPPSPFFARSFVAAISGTYFAWTAFFMFTDETLSILVPVVGLLMPYVGKNGVLTFLMWPIAISFAVVAWLALVIRLTSLKVSRSFVWTFTVATAMNCAFMTSAIVAATLVAEEAISLAAGRLNPVCFERRSFIQSLRHSGNSHSSYAHAIVRLQGGEQYYWSYATQSFFMGNPRLDKNFLCQNGTSLQ